jgi:hypothetical protein
MKNVNIYMIADAHIAIANAPDSVLRRDHANAETVTQANSQVPTRDNGVGFSMASMA